MYYRSLQTHGCHLYTPADWVTLKVATLPCSSAHTRQGRWKWCRHLQSLQLCSKSPYCSSALSAQTYWKAQDGCPRSIWKPPKGVPGRHLGKGKDQDVQRMFPPKSWAVPPPPKTMLYVCSQDFLLPSLSSEYTASFCEGLWKDQGCLH